MNIILIIIAVLAGLIALLFIAALFTREDYAIQREIIINRPKQQVFDYIRMIKNQDKYNKWWMIDPNVKKDYVGTDGTVGFIAYWDSDIKKAGKGEQEIKEISDGEQIDCEIRFIKPFKGIAYTNMSTKETSADQTLVTWGFKGKNKYPANIMNLLVSMDKILGGDLHMSLVNLKNIMESIPPTINKY